MKAPEPRKSRAGVDKIYAVDVKAVVKDVLGMDPSDAVDVDATFSSLGFDSMLSVLLASSLVKATRGKVPLSATVAFDYPSIRLLNDHIDSFNQAKKDAAVSRREVSSRSTAVDVTSVVKEVLGLKKTDPVDMDAPFSSFGFNSNLSVLLARQLTTATDGKVPLSATVAFDYPSIRLLKDHIESFGQTKKSIISHSSDVGHAAVIRGGACRFGTAWKMEKLWVLFRSGHDGVVEVPESRWNWAKNNGSISKWGGFFEGIDQFDAAFFGITPREAVALDPQRTECC